MNVVTADLSQFGYRELSIASDLLAAYAKHNADFLGSGLTLNVNRQSGYVFLSDEEYRVGLLDDEGRLREWYYCHYCSNEGFDGGEYYKDGEVTKMQFELYDGYCSADCRRAAGG